MQPIATAPKDGSFVILEDQATGTREIAQWLEGNWVGENGTSITFHPTRWTTLTEKQDEVAKKSVTRSRASGTRSRASATRSKPRDRATQKGRSSNAGELSSSPPYEKRTRYRSIILLLSGICSAMLVVLLFRSQLADHQTAQLTRPETSSRSVQSPGGAFRTNASNESSKGAVAAHLLETEHVNPVTADTETTQMHSLGKERARADALAEELAEVRQEMESRLALATAAATQTSDSAQAAETTQQALEEARARADALAKELAEVRQDMESRLALATAAVTQASDSAQAAETTQQALEEERARADALAKELAEARREMETRLALATAAATQASDAAQAAETTVRQRQQALEEERARADALAKELAEARREMESRLAPATTVAGRASDSAQAAEATQQALEKERARADALVEELAETRQEMETRVALATAAVTQASDSAQAAETTVKQRQQALEEERARADVLAKELAEARREMESRLAPATTVAGRASDSAQAAEASTRQRQQGLRDRLLQLQASLSETITAVSHSSDVAVERSSGWGRYRDKELGLTFDLPAHIFSLDSAERGRPGTLFSSPDGRAQIRVFGFVNEANDTPRQYLRRTARTDQVNFTYVHTASTFFVVSGTRDGMIFYRRCNFSSSAEKRIGCIQLDYPQREKRAWDAAVTRMSRSLRMVALD